MTPATPWASYSSAHPDPALWARLSEGLEQLTVALADTAETARRLHSRPESLADVMEEASYLAAELRERLLELRVAVEGGRVVRVQTGVER